MAEEKDLHFIDLAILLTLYFLCSTSEAAQCITW